MNSHYAQNALVVLLLRASLLSVSVLEVSAWGGSASDVDITSFGNSLSRDWLYNSKGISMKFEGCVWGFVPRVKDQQDNSGCRENESSDGTTYWYQMANCRRPQAVFSLYASESSSSASCTTNTFKESFITLHGAPDFFYYLAQDSNTLFGGSDDSMSYDYLPMCEKSDYGYIGLACTDDGSFVMEYFDDYYCTTPTGKTYNSLNTLNKILKNYKSCNTIDSSSSYSGGRRENENKDQQQQQQEYYSSTAEALVYTSEGCSNLDSDFCISSTRYKNSPAQTITSKSLPSNWVTKLKFVAGGLFLLGAFVMFTGILFTNRRRRRALMQRKYRQARSREERSRRSKSRSKSKSRRRSKSKSRDSKAGAGDEGTGVFT